VFDSHLRPTGRDYTPTICLLALAFVFSPAVLIASRPLGYWSVSMAILCSVTCSALAWMRWKRSSLLTIASITSSK
jgi:hypothetical protein